MSVDAVTLGQDPSCDVVITDDEYVSSKHARIQPYGNRWCVVDLGSTNGTWIRKPGGGPPMRAEPRLLLWPGDLVGLGQRTWLRWETVVGLDG